MRYKITFWIILTIGIGLRLYHAWTAPYAYVYGDTATTWLMARHILQGEFPLFFYGQYYLGPLEALTTAFFFIIFGIKAATLYLGTIFYSGLFIISAYFLGKELKDRTAGLLMMLYIALPPPYFFGESITTWGYHIEILFFGNILFILALKIPQVLHGGRKTLYYILFGLVSGIGFWTHYIILYYLAPVGLYLFINEKWKDILRNAIPTAVSFFLIGLPFWIFAFRYNLATFKFQSKPSPPGAIITLFKLFVQNINYMFNTDFNSGALSSMVLIIYIMSIVYFMFCSFFNRKNHIIVFFSISVMLFYVGYKTKNYAVEVFYYLLPILTFMSAAFGYFCRRFRVVGVCAVVFIVSFNTRNISQHMSGHKDISDSNRRMIYDKIKFLLENRIFRFIGHEGNSGIPVFFSNERIIATGFMDCRYAPYEDIIEASDRVAFEKSENDWRPTLDNICKGYDFKMNLFYNFRPLLYKTKMINLPANDRNYNTFWTDKRGEGFSMDLGKVYTICKIELYNGHRYGSYPSSCMIQTSLDGYNWEDAVYIKNVEPLFWSGPRIYWHPMDGRVQWFFNPKSARFIRLIGPQALWEINEIFVYEYLGDEVLRVRDYVKDAKDIIRLLISKGINFVYTDFWLSAKIRSLSKGKVEALVPYNSYLPPRVNMSREVHLGRDRAFILKTGDTEEIEDILNEFRMPFEKASFRYYTCYYFPQLEEGYESIHSLLWVGVGMIRHSLKDYSDWLYNQGDYERALRYYPNNFMAYLRCKGLPATRFFPKVPKTIDFINGPRFLGYSVRGKKIIPGRIIRMEYFWEVKDEIKGDISMFVHFVRPVRGNASNGVRDNKIVFQNDHRFLYQYPRPLRPLPGERFREVMKLEIPKDIGPGSYQIIIGLWDERKKERIHMIEPSGKKTSKKIIGELVIYET